MCGLPLAVGGPSKKENSSPPSFFSTDFSKIWFCFQNSTISCSRPTKSSDVSTLRYMVSSCMRLLEKTKTSAFRNTRRHFYHQNKRSFAAWDNGLRPRAELLIFLPAGTRGDTPKPSFSPLSAKQGVLCARKCPRTRPLLTPYFFSIISSSVQKSKRFSGNSGQRGELRADAPS